jgi:hypothetical protein
MIWLLLAILAALCVLAFIRFVDRSAEAADLRELDTEQERDDDGDVTNNLDI